MWNHGSAAGSAGTGSIPISDEPAGVPSGAVSTEPSAGAVEAGQPGHPPHRQRVGQPEQHGGHQQHAQRGAGLAQQQSEHLDQIPGMRRTSRSIRKMPTNGVTTPPSP